MSIRRCLSLLAICLLVGSLFQPAAAGSKKKEGPLVVGRDRVGDWGKNVRDSLAPVGDLLGQDLVEASIGIADPDTANFIIKVNRLPPAGGMPEVTRYLWEFTVDGEFFMLDGKFTNYTRATCDPYSGACPPPRDPGMYPFIIYDGCRSPVWWPECHEVGLVHATFDQPSGTITIPVPLEIIQARAGSRIEIGVGPYTFVEAYGGNVVAVPSAYRTTDGFPVDVLRTNRDFVIPGVPPITGAKKPVRMKTVIYAEPTVGVAFPYYLPIWCFSGCPWFDILPGERYVSVAANDDVSEDVALAILPWDGDNQNPRYTVHHACTSTDELLELPSWARVVLVEVLSGPCRDGTPAAATRGSLTATFSNRR